MYWLKLITLSTTQLNSFSNWALNIKWNSFRMIKLINQKYVEHQSIVYYESKSETQYFNISKPLFYYYITDFS